MEHTMTSGQSCLNDALFQLIYQASANSLQHVMSFHSSLFPSFTTPSPSSLWFACDARLLDTRYRASTLSGGVTVLSSKTVPILSHLVSRCSSWT